MSHTRGKKLSRKQKAIHQSLQMVQSLKTLQDKGALKIDPETREVWIVREIFWDGKDLNWRKNFTANLYFLMERHLDKHTGKPFHIFSIDLDTKEKKDYITSYFPELKVCKEMTLLK